MLPAAKKNPFCKSDVDDKNVSSSFGSDFNSDFSFGFTEEQQREGGIEYNYRREATTQFRGGKESAIASRTTPDGFTKGAAMTGTDVATYTCERPGMSTFVIEDGRP
jgi:predicted dithiol-disulfide oxidoreductase (DUF899 family)